MKQTGIDNFIHRIQVGSRINTEGKVTSLRPIQEVITFNIKPSKINYVNHPAVLFCVDISALALYRMSA